MSRNFLISNHRNNISSSLNNTNSNNTSNISTNNHSHATNNTVQQQESVNNDQATLRKARLSRVGAASKNLGSDFRKNQPPQTPAHAGGVGERLDRHSRAVKHISNYNCSANEDNPVYTVVAVINFQTRHCDSALIRQFDVERHLPDFRRRLVCGYALAKSEVETATGNQGACTGRGNDFSAKLKSAAFKQSGEFIADHILSSFERLMKTPLEQNAHHFSYEILKKEGAPLDDYNTIVTGIYNSSLALSKYFIEEIFGTLLDEESIKTATARVTSDAGVELAVRWRAVDELDADEDVKRDIKKIMAADCLVLRGINPGLLARLPELKDEKLKSGLKDLMKVIQLLANAPIEKTGTTADKTGAPVEQKIAPVGETDAGLGKRDTVVRLAEACSSLFYKFAEKVVAQAEQANKTSLDQIAEEGKTALKEAEQRAAREAAAGKTTDGSDAG